ncbi:MAG: peptidase M28, partial [Pseudoalteromonas sp.]
MSFKLVNASLLFSFAALSFSASSVATIQYQEQQKLHDIAASVSASRIESDIQSLVDFGTRHTLSETKSDTRGIGAARRWIKAEFEKISAECGGCLEVIEVKDTISGEKRIPDPV